MAQLPEKAYWSSFNAKKAKVKFFSTRTDEKLAKILLSELVAASGVYRVGEHCFQVSAEKLGTYTNRLEQAATALPAQVVLPPPPVQPPPAPQQVAPPVIVEQPVMIAQTTLAELLNGKVGTNSPGTRVYLDGIIGRFIQERNMTVLIPPQLIVELPLAQQLRRNVPIGVFAQNVEDLIAKGSSNGSTRSRNVISKDDQQVVILFRADNHQYIGVTLSAMAVKRLTRIPRKTVTDICDHNQIPVQELTGVPNVRHELYSPLLNCVVIPIYADPAQGISPDTIRRIALAATATA